MKTEVTQVLVGIKKTKKRALAIRGVLDREAGYFEELSSSSYYDQVFNFIDDNFPPYHHMTAYVDVGIRQMVMDYIRMHPPKFRKQVQFKKVEEKLVGFPKFEEHDILLADHDTDLRIVLPTGLEVVFQYRVENQTIDLCLGKDGKDEARHVYVTSADLSKAKVVRGSGGALLGEQITIM